MKARLTHVEVTEPRNLGEVTLNISFKAKPFTLDKNKKYDVEIKEHREHRSLNANSYCWVVCEKIAKAINSTKIDVYKRAIRDVGTFMDVQISSVLETKLIANWEENGIGWIAEKQLGNGITSVVRLYSGSSSYDTAEMARLIDWLVDEAKELNIDVLTPKERSLLLQDWSETYAK